MRRAVLARAAAAALRRGRAGTKAEAGAGTMSGGGLKTMGRASMPSRTMCRRRQDPRTFGSMCMACPAPISATPATTAAASGRPTACQALSHEAADAPRARAAPRTIAARSPCFETAQRPREVGQRVVRRRRHLVQRPGERIPQGSRHARRALRAAALRSGWPPRERLGSRRTLSMSPSRRFAAGCSRATAARTAAARSSAFRSRTATGPPRALPPSSG